MDAADSGTVSQTIALANGTKSGAADLVLQASVALADLCCASVRL